ncbi:hypothetical protein GCM10009107_00830 [Ideonella azotifigens]|uniref:Tc1-like transposase DDE domain-containing protein n=1 Tax=Ideonella azotifigens TaxID=513160 RepID=A0ABN1JH79_9BURK
MPKKSRATIVTHDYKRNGTTKPFAALNVLDGQVIGQCQRHTHAEWLKFLRKIDRETPKEKKLHLIADNYATHKHPAVQEWLARHPSFNMHLTPTSAPWLNMVERFFRDITTEPLRRGVFTSVPGQVKATRIGDRLLNRRNGAPNHFRSPSCRAPCRSTRDDIRGVRTGMGVEEPTRERHHRRPAHRSAMGWLSASA